MADWGLYSALRGTDNWAQRRQDKAMNMQIVQQQAADEEKKTQQAMQAEEGINKYLDEIANIDVLPEDQERIKEVERNARQNIVQGIARNNGDLARYVSSGGITDLHEYKNSIIQSDEVKTALSNKENMALIISDKQKGNRWFKPVEVDVPEVDENGEPILDAEGNPTMKKKKVSIDDQLKLYKRGVINTVTYNGSENKVNLNAMSFHGTPKDPKNPYSKDNIVTAADIKFQAMEAGASEDYANELAKSYYKTASDAKAKGQDATWKWGNKSEEERLAIEATINAKRAAAAKSAGGGGIKVLNAVIPAIQRLGKKGEAQTMVMAPQEAKWWGQSLSLGYDKATNTFKPKQALAGIDVETGTPYDLTNAMSVNLSNKYVSKTINGVTKRYVEANVLYDADAPGKNNPHYESMGIENTLKDENSRHNWQEFDESELGVTGAEDGNVWKGKVLIPIENQINTPTFKTAMNKFLNLRSNIDAAAASATDQDYLQSMTADAQAIMKEHPGATYEDVMSVLKSMQQEEGAY